MARRDLSEWREPTYALLAIVVGAFGAMAALFVIVLLYFLATGATWTDSVSPLPAPVSIAGVVALAGAVPGAVLGDVVWRMKQNRQ